VFQYLLLVLLLKIRSSYYIHWKEVKIFRSKCDILWYLLVIKNLTVMVEHIILWNVSHFFY